MTFLILILAALGGVLIGYPRLWLERFEPKQVDAEGNIAPQTLRRTRLMGAALVAAALLLLITGQR